MNQSTTTFLKRRFPIIIFLLVTFVSCGGQKPTFITGLKVTPAVTNGDVWIDVSADLKLGNIMLPNLNIPVVVPGVNRYLGDVVLISNQNVDKLILKINLSEIIHLQAKKGSLPNGQILPLIGENNVIEIKLGNQKNVSLYLTFSDGQMAIGTAIPIRGMDNLGNTMGTTSMFPAFNLSGVYGALGLFTSKSKGQNGIGFFADITNVVPKEIFGQLGGQSFNSSLDYTQRVPTKSVEEKLNREIYKMNKRKADLSK